MVYADDTVHAQQVLAPLLASAAGAGHGVILRAPSRPKKRARCYSARMKLLLKWLLSAAALLLVAYLYSGVQVDSFTSALIAALVIGLFNAVLRPVLVVLTLPVTIVTVGLFLFVVNALMFWAAAGVLDGFHVAGFWAALLGSLIYSVLGLLIESALGGLFLEK